jgi:hypothetical protein
MQALYQLSYSPLPCATGSPGGDANITGRAVHHQIVSVAPAVALIAGTSSRGPGRSQAVTNE